MGNNEYFRQLVERYIENKATEEELEVFFHLLTQGKLDHALADYIDSEQHAEILKNALDAPSGKKQLKYSIYRIICIAAVLVVLLFINLLTFRHWTSVQDWLNPVVYGKISTGKNQLKSIKLSDGSVIWLNGNSSLRYPSRFAYHSRAVELIEGEAFFDIAHDVSRPFMVKSGNIRTNVLGTAFNIQSYKFINSIKVTVTKGKVAVQSNYTNAATKKQLILNANDQADVNRQTGVITKREVKAVNVMNWREGGLCFNNESFRDVAAILEQKFGFKILFSDKAISDYRFTAGFKATESLWDILNVLSLANNLTYKTDQNTVTFKKTK